MPDVSVFAIVRERSSEFLSLEGEVGVPWQVWSLLLDMTSCIPAGNPWQDCLSQSLARLRQRDGSISEADPVSTRRDLLCVL